MRQRTITLRAIALIVIVCCAFLPIVLSSAMPVDAHQKTDTSLSQTPLVDVSTTPTVDPTVAALEKAKLYEEVTNLQHQNNQLWSFVTTLLPPLLLALTGALGIVKYAADREAERKKQVEEQIRWLEDRKSEREKRAEERFQEVVVGLGNEKMEARIGAAIMLRTFLHPDYEKFYSQAFDLAVAYLRSCKIGAPFEDTFSQALIMVFKESFSLARDELKKQKSFRYSPQFLNATGIQLDTASLDRTDLVGAWLPQSSFQQASLIKTQLGGAILTEANLKGADLTDANLEGANLDNAELTGAILKIATLTGAYLIAAHLNEADLSGAILKSGHLNRADLEKANLTGTYLEGAVLIAARLENANLEGARLASANLEGANLKEANLRNAHLLDTNLRGANLTGANLRGANLTGANLRGANLTGAQPETAKTLKDADMGEIVGLSPIQLTACIQKGAIIDS